MNNTKKNIKNVLIIIIFLLVILSIIMYIFFNKNTHDKKLYNPYNIEKYNFSGNYDKYDIYKNNKAFTVSYPSELHLYDKNHTSLQLSDNYNVLDKKISAVVTIDETTLSNYINMSKASIMVDLNDEAYDEVKFNDIVYEKKYNNKNYAFLNYFILKDKKIVNKYYIGVEIESNMIMTISLESNYLIDYEVIERMIDYNLKKDFSKNLLDKNGKGTISINEYEKYDAGYNLNLNIPNGYKEISSDVSIVEIEKENIESSESVNLTLNHNMSGSIYEKCMSSEKAFKSIIEGDKYKNNYVTTGILNETINGKAFTFYISSYDFNDDNGNFLFKQYYASVFYKLDNNTYFEMDISNKNLSIDVNFISQFTDFEVEVY